MQASFPYSFDMDQNSTDFSAQKDACAKELLDLMIKSLEAGTLTADESEKASRFIVEHFDRATDIYYLQASVESLVANWPCFQPALLSFKNQEAESQDQTKIKETQQKLQEIQNQTPQ